MAKKEKVHPVRSKQHWEMQYNTNPKGPITPANAFEPKQGKSRPTTHVKINNTDH